MFAARAGLTPRLRTRRRLAIVLAAAALLVPATLGAQDPAPAPAAAHGATDRPAPAAQDPHAAPPGGEAAHAPASGAADHGEEGAHEESLWPLAGKIVNFALLVGTIVYFARSPLASYFTTRKAQVRSDLVQAEAMKQAAAAQIADMDAKLEALPGELEALKARGRQEIAAEEKRIRDLAEAERARLLDQARREIDQRVRVARRELVEHAAALAVGVAEKKINARITDADRSRLVDRYLAEVKSHE